MLRGLSMREIQIAIDCEPQPKISCCQRAKRRKYHDFLAVR
jgi:hypothetical protein